MLRRRCTEFSRTNARDGIAAWGGGSLAAVPLSPSSRSTHRRSLNLLSPSRGVSFFSCCNNAIELSIKSDFNQIFQFSSRNNRPVGRPNGFHSLRICINGDTLSRSQSSASYGSSAGRSTWQVDGQRHLWSLPSEKFFLIHFKLKLQGQSHKTRKNTSREYF